MIAYRLDINAGDLIDDKYIVISRIGSGSYGDVFKVKDMQGSEFALKLLRLWEVSGELHESLVAKFEQEYKTGRLSSEYLIHSLDFGVVRGNPYLLMEFCSKGDLSKYIGRDLVRLPYFAHDILEGLHTLHSEGKVHRDLKPENVLIRNNGMAALTDFGVVGEMDQSKRMSEVGWLKKRPKQIQGTPLYMAPEMANREGGGVTYLPTVDIWSFGVMMYELLTGGAFPFGNIEQIEDLPAYQERAKKGKWDMDRLRAVSQGDGWFYIIERCLCPNYRERYQSALEVLQDMKPMIGNVNPAHIQKRLSRSALISTMVVTQGDNVGTVYVLSRCMRNQGRMLRLGRGYDNDIVLTESDSTYLSRYHFTLERSVDGSFWIIRDGQWRKNERRWVTSTNGTYLNATPVTQEGLKVFTGDIITAGEYKIKVE
ncbi:MAG: protein kinase [Bacteroidaceae bacterium]